MCRLGGNRRFILPIVQKAICCIEQQLSCAFYPGADKPYVLIIDSKDSIGADSLRVIERLTACRTNSPPLLNCVLFHTAASDVEQYAANSETLGQLDNHFWLRRLTLSEISDYLRHHMMLFDFNRRDLFTREMAYFIADRSEGVFKSINTLARNAFTIANLEEADKLSMSHLLMAGLPMLDDSETKPGLMTRYRRLATVALMGSCAIASIGVMLYLVA